MTEDNELGVVHYHFHCFEHMIKLNYIAMISHGYISDNWDTEKQLESLKALEKKQKVPVSIHEIGVEIRFLTNPKEYKHCYYNGIDFNAANDNTLLRDKIIALHQKYERTNH